MSYTESFLARRMICRAPTNNLNRIFQAVPGQLPLVIPVADGLHQLLSASNRFWSGDEELREKIRTAPFYQYGAGTSASWCCSGLRRATSTPSQWTSPPRSSPSSTSCRSRPAVSGSGCFSEDVAPGESPEDLHSRLPHMLGNLTLTAVNSELSNHPFERKQDLLQGSHLEMNRRIAATERWGAKEIRARRRKPPSTA
ncbi:HNH endonuclease family protein [Streptomyces mexicanus]|uniref:HNH endonuclease family protein n=1 Tax=Streptomyces mexicanus TaxID=178566 RepID=UPI0036533BA0